jgi:hypothetical protein
MKPVTEFSTLEVAAWIPLHLRRFGAKRPSLKLKTWPEHCSGFPCFPVKKEIWQQKEKKNDFLWQLNLLLPL